MSAEPPRPPRLVRWLLQLLPLGDRRPEVEDDVTELFARRATQHGRGYATWRLLGDAVSLLLTERRAVRRRAPVSRASRMWGGHYLQDLRGAARLFRRRPGIIGGTAAGLALAIAVCTTVFTIVDTSLLRQYGMDNPHTVVRVQRLFDRGLATQWPYDVFAQLRAQARLARVEASSSDSVSFSWTPDGEGVHEGDLLAVSGGYLQMLGARAAHGRILLPADDLAGAAGVVVLNHAFWKARFGADASIVGRTAWLSGRPWTIAGVLEPGFTGPEDTPPAIWAPLRSYQAAAYGEPEDRSSAILVDVIARVLEDRKRAPAQAELSAIAAALPDRADVGAGRTARTTGVGLQNASSPLDSTASTDAVLIISLIFLFVGLVLALACANVANLLLAGAARRAKEIGIRFAMGASRSRIVRQLLTESLLIGVAAGLLGVALTFWTLPIVTAAVGMPATYDLRLDVRVLLFATAIALAAGAGAGLAPARHGARRDLAAILKSDGAQSGTPRSAARLRRWFIGFQAAASIVLLVTAALFTRAAAQIATMDLGVEAERLVAASPRFGRGFPDAAIEAYWRAALERTRAIPSVENASLVLYAPFGDAVGLTNLDVNGARYRLLDNRTDAAYFDTAGVRLVRGRGYSEDEVAASAPVAVVSENVVRDFFGDRDPIGASLGHVFRDLTGVTVVGVVREGAASRIRGAGGTVYRPLDPVAARAARLLIRGPQPAGILRDVQRTLTAVDSRVRPDVHLVKDDLERHAREPRVLAGVSMTVAAIALGLAVLGMHGVTAFVVGERTREISVRMAIGGSAASVVGLLIRQSVRPILIGGAIGMAIALGVSRLIAPGLSGTSPYDPLALASAVLVLVATSLAAVLAPARRAAKADPALVLRE
jgi:predicted permease